MQNSEPMITSIPTDEKFREMVDEMITPEYADAEARYLSEMLMAVASEEDQSKWELANMLARHAFTKTYAFENAFREFRGDRHLNLLPLRRSAEITATDMEQ